MGIFSKGIFGGFTGGIGNVVGSSWRGTDYMRSKPNKTRNPNTPAQQTQRLKFGKLMGFLKSVKPVVQAGYKTYAKNQTPLNSASSYNLRKAMTGSTPEEVQIDFAAAMVTRGALMPTRQASVQSTAAGQVTFQWTNELIGNASGDDRGLLLLYNTERQRAIYVVDGGPLRSDQAYTVQVPSQYRGENMEAYLGFVSADGREASDSQYLGSFSMGD
jgi:hypothetical protein